VLVPEGFSPQERLAGVLDQLDETIFLVDVEPGPSLRFVRITGRAMRLESGVRAEFDGRLVEEVLPPEGAARAYHSWVLALETGTPQRYQTEARFPDGRRRVVDVTVFATSGGGQLAGVIRDITNDVESLEHVRQSDELNRAVLDAMPAATAVLDHRGVIRLANAAWLVDAADLALRVPLPGADFVEGMQHVPDVATATRGVLDGDPGAFDTDHLDGDRWFSLRVAPFEVAGERGAIVTRTDVTARIDEQRSLQQLHNRWEAAFNTAAIGMGLVQLDGRFMLVNPRLCELFGRTEAEMLEITTADVSVPGDAGLRAQIAGLPQPDAGSEGIERRYLRPDGTVVWTWVTWSLVQDDLGDHYFVQFQDIGQRKRAEARLADHQAVLELVASGADLEAVLQKVAEVGEAHLPGSRWVIMATGGPGWTEEITCVGVRHARGVEVEEAYRTFVPTRWHDEPGVVVIPADGGTPLGAALGLGGAWTMPVVDEGGHVSGFVVVHDPPESAGPEDRTTVEQLSSVVRIALQRDAATRRLAERMLEDDVTGLPSRTLSTSAPSRRWRASGTALAAWRSCASASTASAASTRASVTSPATRSWPRSPVACASRRPRPAPSPGVAVTSSSCSSRTWRIPRPPSRSPTGSSPSFGAPCWWTRWSSPARPASASPTGPGPVVASRTWNRTRRSRWRPPRPGGATGRSCTPTPSGSPCLG
jgi:PAS domain S-box-containing protein